MVGMSLHKLKYFDLNDKIYFFFYSLIKVKSRRNMGQNLFLSHILKNFIKNCHTILVIHPSAGSHDTEQINDVIQ